jgi:hypothetical protein
MQRQRGTSSARDWRPSCGSWRTHWGQPAWTSRWGPHWRHKGRKVLCDKGVTRRIAWLNEVAPDISPGAAHRREALGSLWLVLKPISKAEMLAVLNACSAECRRARYASTPDSH